jgi:lysophospholipase L1-like esterase
MRKLLEQRACGVWVDVFPAMLAGGGPRPELFAADGLHLNADGYALWREVVSRYRPAAF